ncbi:hypothetical protein [Croceicoccus sp. YJ47]|uniref:hypothetical protein n=1 Tax=Croceicoccus sp. YJ47 TaxID=2798724 RepID=UPI00192464C8|nr:hypothetical protein [Croceicoccus sp. YJ47]QQN73166.1 hypothetical protein JD971_09825 [Croceicoccus sp. YJ47]
MQLIRTRDRRFPCTLADLRAEFPSDSFPREPSAAMLAKRGYAIVHPSPMPAGDVVEEADMPEFVDGRWQQAWTVRAFSEDERARFAEQARADFEAALIAERERRLALGFDYDFGDVRGVHRIGTSEADMRAWSLDVTPYAQALAGTNDDTTAIAIVTDTGPVAVTGPEWLDVLKAAAAIRQPIWHRYFELLAADAPIDPADPEAWA